MDNPIDRSRISTFDPASGSDLKSDFEGQNESHSDWRQFKLEQSSNSSLSEEFELSGEAANQSQEKAFFSKWIKQGKMDRASVIYALIGSAVFLVLGFISLELMQIEAAPESVWLPAAAVTALLLRSRMRNELPFFAGICCALLALNFYSGNSPSASGVYSIATIVEIILVIGLIRRSCGFEPDMSNVKHLGQCLLFVGVIGPTSSTIIVGFCAQFLGDGMHAPAVSWFLSHSMGMVLLVPALLLTSDALRNRKEIVIGDLLERLSIMAGGLLIVFAVFAQDRYPLFFLIPPISLLIAFRAGGLGTALYVPAIALVASLMTIWGSGPIAAMATTGSEQLYLLQAFIAANFLTGLPVAAILASRERLTEEMVAARAELALLTENVTDVVLHVDDNGICTYASSSVQEVLGRSPDQFVGCPITDQTPGSAHERIAEVLSRLQSGQSDKERVTYQRKISAEDGSPVFIEADAVKAKDPFTAERNGIVICARDVTERVELELLLTGERRKAEEAAEAKSEFLANMSHEIRTPMNGVLGFAELMLQSDLGEEHRRHTEMIVQSGRSMMLLLNDILDLSKIEAGQIVVDEAPVDLLSTLEECVMLHRSVAEGKGLTLEFKPPMDGPLNADKLDNAIQPMVMTDPLRLRQIVLNLIGNAVKFTENGRVDVICEANDETISISVKDSGIGISPERIESIFSAFSQAETDTARRFGGTGLGLTISLQLADLLGGTIEVESEEGFGSNFRLLLPAKIIEVEAAAEETSSQPKADVNKMSPDTLPVSARILLVEDHDVNRMLATEMLERCGQTVEVACDGNEAIAMVMDSVLRHEPYDLVLMDIQMPGCDGYAATRAIREEGITPDTIPILALTANAYPEDIQQARKAGMQAHLTKPIIFPDLARALQRWLPTKIIEVEPGEQIQAVSQLNGAPMAPMPAPAEPIPSDTPAPTTAVNPSPALAERWNTRRSEAIEGVRTALESGELGCETKSAQDWDELARLVHKLAGTAAIFGEPDLGDQASAFERALRQNLESDVRESLAFELLRIADDPTDRRAVARG